MKNKLIYPMVVVVLAACGGDEGRGARAGQQYETVQEGSASGVTSTIAGPGETLPPMTGTNIDGTSAFTLNPNVAPQPIAAGAIPPSPVHGDAAVATPSMSSSMSSPSGTPAPRSAPSVAVAQPQRTAERPVYSPPPMTSASRPAEPEQPREAQPAEVPTTSGPTDTSATNTAPPPQKPPQQESQPEPPQQEQQEADAEDEPAAEEPPPPPPPAV